MLSDAPSVLERTFYDLMLRARLLEGEFLTLKTDSFLNYGISVIDAQDASLDLSGTPNGTHHTIILSLPIDYDCNLYFNQSAFLSSKLYANTNFRSAYFGYMLSIGIIFQ